MPKLNLFVTTPMPSAVNVVFNKRALFGIDGEAIVLPAEPDAEQDARAIVSVIPTEGLPVAAALLFRGGELHPDKSGCPHRLIRWGGGNFELLPHFSCPPERSAAPAPIDRLESAAASYTLYRDCGLRLSVERSGEQEQSYFICQGTGGSLRMMDVGSEMLLIIHATGCAAEDDPAASELSSERLIVLNGADEIIASVTGERCTVEDGYLVSVTSLGTVLGHEERKRYELAGESIRRADLASGEAAFASEPTGELGFFTHAPHLPENAREAGLCLLECLLLGREKEALSLLSPALSKGLDFASLEEFFGDFDDALPPPAALEASLLRLSGEKEKAPSEGGAWIEHSIVGAVKGFCATAYLIAFENGLIKDISELAPPCDEEA